MDMEFTSSLKGHQDIIKLYRFKGINYTRLKDKMPLPKATIINSDAIKGANKFLALRYFQFNIVDVKPIIDQVHELTILAFKWELNSKSYTIQDFVTHLKVKAKNHTQDALIIGLFIKACRFKNSRNKTTYGSISTNTINLYEQDVKELIMMVIEMQNDMVIEVHMVTVTKSSEGGWILRLLFMYATIKNDSRCMQNVRN
ncbi:wall-associated receptor kinase 2-like protein [Gossypium australe]|uniref:Wall-associated receptor kinase 2-like protein n=1 Tax=Gossypium australe TaxID=47621 RepID=A0A5B6U4Y3_9ROSI|nr:wall-associated receptor kinase 2-like protein [Gossypium australe]